MMPYKKTKGIAHLSISSTLSGSLAKRYISAIYIYNMPRLYSTNLIRSNKRKKFRTKKDKEQTITCTNYDRRRLRR